MSERWFPNSMPQPMVDPISLPWWRAAAEHKLTVQRCEECHHCTLPPSPVCSECRSENLALQEVSGKGTLYTYTTVHRPVAMDQQLPFVIALVDLDMTGVDSTNSVRFMTNIVDADSQELQIGKAVEVAWETMSEEVSVPRFRFSA